MLAKLKTKDLRNEHVLVLRYMFGDYTKKAGVLSLLFSNL